MAMHRIPGPVQEGHMHSCLGSERSGCYNQIMREIIIAFIITASILVAVGASTLASAQDSSWASGGDRPVPTATRVH